MSPEVRESSEYYRTWSTIADRMPVGSVWVQVPDSEGGRAQTIGDEPIIYLGRSPNRNCVFLTQHGIQTWACVLFRQLSRV